jgi:hypothetical protein
MGILYDSRQPQGPHLSIFSHFAFEDDAALPVDNDHFERGTALARLAWPDKSHHFAGQSARDVLVARRLHGSREFVLDSSGEPAVVLHFPISLSVRDSAQKKLELSSKKPAPEDARRAPYARDRLL